MRLVFDFDFLQQKLRDLLPLDSFRAPNAFSRYRGVSRLGVVSLCITCLHLRRLPGRHSSPSNAEFIPGHRGSLRRGRFVGKVGLVDDFRRDLNQVLKLGSLFLLFLSHDDAVELLEHREGLLPSDCFIHERWHKAFFVGVFPDELVGDLLRHLRHDLVSREQTSFVFRSASFCSRAVQAALAWHLQLR